MTSQVFYRKWRPQALAEVVGQEHVTRTLLNALITGRVAHAYLFCGPRGTGKTSTGRILAKAVNCLKGGQGEPCNACAMCLAVTEGRAMDVIEVDAASNRGIDEVRDLREKVRFAPNAARYKVYIIDEVHMLTEPAANALLKTLEEPPPHVIFVLATTEPHKVPATVLSRCQRFDFRRIPQDAMSSRLQQLSQQEGISIDDAALRLIARSATGSMRDAENLLEQAVAYYGSEIHLGHVQAMLGVTGDVRAQQLARHIMDRALTAGLQTIAAVAQDGIDLRQFNRELVEYIRCLLLVKAGAPQAVDVNEEELGEMRGIVAAASMEQISRALKLFRQVDLQFDGFSTLPLELALVDCTLKEGEERPRPVRMPPVKKTAVTPAAAEPKGSKEIAKVITEEKPVAKQAQEETVPAAVNEPVAAHAEASREVSQPESSDDVSYLRNRWKEVVRATKGMGSSGNLDALLRNACEPVSLDGDTIVLGFYFDFHKEKIEDPKYRHMVEKKASEIFGKDYKIRCILTERARKAPDPEPKVHGHVVDAALKIGGRIVEEEDK